MGFATEMVEEIVEESFENFALENDLPMPEKGPLERRKHPRNSTDFPVNFRIILEDGRIFNRGTAKVADLGPGGAMLSGFSCARDAFPTRNFSIAFKVNAGEFEGVEAVCTPVRFSFTPSFGIGVRFESISVRV